MRTIGPLTPAECLQRCDEGAPATEWIAALVADRRLVEVRLAGQTMVCTIEDIGLVRDGFGVPSPPGFGDVPGPGPAAAVARLVLRQLRSRCGVSAEFLAQRWGAGSATISVALHHM